MKLFNSLHFLDITVVISGEVRSKKVKNAFLLCACHVLSLLSISRIFFIEHKNKNLLIKM